MVGSDRLQHSALAKTFAFRRNSNVKKYICATVLATTLAAGTAPAWWIKGHETIATAAVAGLPDDMPAFFRAWQQGPVHSAGDPDRWKNPAAKQLAPPSARSLHRP